MRGLVNHGRNNRLVSATVWHTAQKRLSPADPGACSDLSVHHGRECPVAGGIPRRAASPGCTRPSGWAALRGACGHSGKCISSCRALESPRRASGHRASWGGSPNVIDLRKYPIFMSATRGASEHIWEAVYIYVSSSAAQGTPCPLCPCSAQAVTGRVGGPEGSRSGVALPFHCSPDYCTYSFYLSAIQPPGADQGHGGSEMLRSQGGGFYFRVFPEGHTCQNAPPHRPSLL